MYCANIASNELIPRIPIIFVRLHTHTHRRTVSDIITFIPFVIILLIPLSPVGHVFVFGAIQRFYPDFFPSMFTERRQNLLQLYENTEYSEITIDESIRVSDKG